MQVVTWLGDWIVPFLIVLTVLVFVHEMGHYLVARWNGIRIEVFSIGFGPEIFGWNDRVGTRWKVSAIPLGGYVKMFGEADVTGHHDAPVEEQSPDEREASFHAKRLGQRAAVVAAGPAANLLLAIILFSGLFIFVGQPFTPPFVGEVQPDSAASEAGLLPGDRIIRIADTEIERFEQIQQIVRMNPEQSLAIRVLRDSAEVDLTAVPRRTVITDRFGDEHEIGRLGVTREGGFEYVRYDPFTALWRAVKETASYTMVTVNAVGQIIAGSRGTDDLGGPIRIAELSGKIAQEGTISLVVFAAVLSINLGLINLLPIPILDGGHLLYYLVEAIRGKPLGPTAQEYGLRMGLAFVLCLFVFVTWNDLMRFEFFNGMFDFLKGLVT